MSAPNRISILMYHQVGRFRPMRSHRANYCDAGRFARQMRLIARLGYRVIDLDTALDCLAGRRPTPKRAAVLTFDDAYENFAEPPCRCSGATGFRPPSTPSAAGWDGAPNGSPRTPGASSRA